MIGQMRWELPTTWRASGRVRRLASLLAGVLAVAGCAWDDTPLPASQAVITEVPNRGTGIRPVPTDPARRAVAVALDQVGVPYRYGGATPGGFDCSGLVHYAYANAGVALPRTTQAQWRALDRVSLADRRAGDLLFFRIDGRLSHVGLYLGQGRFVHAPRTGTRVRVEQLDAPFYANRLAGVARPGR